MPSTIRHLILILGDQLSPAISSLKNANPKTDCVLMVEVQEEATYVRHHKKKIAFLFSAMRHFAKQIQNEGWHIDYVYLDDTDNTGSLQGEIERAVVRHTPKRILTTEPGEWRVLQAMRSLSELLPIPLEILEDDRFIASHEEFRTWAEGRKQLRMEYFYRGMRRKTGLLMNGDLPEGGKWNYDAENRKPAKTDLLIPSPLHTEPDDITSDVLKLVSERFADHFGDLEPFWFGVTRNQALAALDQFIESALPSFGDYQDAMLKEEKFLFHSLLSVYINAGLLNPLEVCRQVEMAYFSGYAPLNAVEGYIRQIIGWREYVRGIYWLNMPDYVNLNFFENTRKLPDFYWTADTEMTCLRSVISQTREEAHAHHIQRLMVTGNFALLAGVDPAQVHEWYLAVYADAYEWVELPNTLGMSQFGDGGVMSSKPYAASGNYMNKMSNYCKHCRYDVKKRTGESACPFNPLYWHFLHRNRNKLTHNPRMAHMYRIWDRMPDESKKNILTTAAAVLKAL